MIYAKEDRDVAIADITGDFLWIDDTSGSTYLKFDGIMAELLARIDPDLYIKYITTYEKGHKIVYAKFLKAPYGTLDTSLILWVKLSTDM